MTKNVKKPKNKTMKTCCNMKYYVVKYQHNMKKKGVKKTNEKFICMYRNKQKRR